MDELRLIRHVFITHSHLDHIAFLPLLIDSVFEQGREPIVVHGSEATLRALKKHIFNWDIWPDFTVLPSRKSAAMEFALMGPLEILTLGNRRIQAIPVNHIVPGVGYCVTSAGGGFAFSGDTGTNDALWEALNGYARLDLLIVEASFPNGEAKIARLSGHYTPELLAQDLRKLRLRPVVAVCHLKPGNEQAIFAQCQQALPDWTVRRIFPGDCLTFPDLPQSDARPNQKRRRAPRKARALRSESQVT